MTVTIGLATKDRVVLAADSAVTHGGAVTESRSSLGEASDTEKGIEEGALKIVTLGSHAAVAMAGTASHAVEAVAWFKPFVHASNFEEAWSKAMSVKQDLAFDLLVARWQDGSPELYRCVGAHAERIQPGRPVVIGANEEERTTLETRTRMLLLRGNRPHMIQLGVCALLVWRALNEVGFKDNIGGTPASLLVDAGGTAWMPDTSVYAVDVQSASDGEPHFHDMIHRVSIIGRDDVVAVASTYTNQTKLLENPLTQDRLMEWRDKWLVEVLNVAVENAVTLIALVALTQRRLAVLELDLCQNKYILVKNDEVEFGDELKRFFLAPSPTLPGGAVYSIPLGEPAALAMADAVDLRMLTTWISLSATCSWLQSTTRTSTTRSGCGSR